MQRKNWNFHNDIAIVLEGMISSKLGPFPSFSADNIERGAFAEAMILLLEEKGKSFLTEEEIEAFREKANPYLDKRSCEIDNEDAQELFGEFRALMRKGR